MHRMLPPALVGVLVLAVVGCASSGPRRVDNLNHGWTFTKPGDAPQKVNLRHTWNAADAQDGGNDYWRGACTYRRTLNVPASLAGKRFFLRFEAASIVADVTVNGHHVGQHRGAFTAFCFDITDRLKPGRRDNVIEIRV